MLPIRRYRAPLALWLPWLALRHRGPMTFTCVNPAIGMGGGVVGESKLAILRALAPEGVLRAVEIPPGAPEAPCRSARSAPTCLPIPGAAEASPCRACWPR